MLEGGGRLLPHGGDMTHQQTDVGGGVGGCCHMCEEDGETWGGGLTNGHGETMGGTLGWCIIHATDDTPKVS